MKVMFSQDFPVPPFLVRQIKQGEESFILHCFRVQFDFEAITLVQLMAYLAVFTIMMAYLTIMMAYLAVFTITVKMVY